MATAGKQQPEAYVCELCKVSCSSALELCDHVVEDKHTTNVGHVSTEEQSQLYKLQYFLDTYLPQEPLVGLEFVEEIQMKSGCRYKCTLCGFNNMRKPFFAHLTGSDHMANFLQTHAPKLYMSPTMIVQPARYVKALQHGTARYYKMHGRKKIKEIEGSDDTYLDMDMENAPKPVPKCKIRVVNTEELQHKAYVCELCNVSCSTVTDLHDHMVGNKHRTIMGYTCPEELSQLNKLQDFLDTYIPQEPLVGLEYVEETQMKSGYRYKCVLCGFNSERRYFFAHLTGTDHMASFLERHAPKLYEPPTMFVNQARYVKALQKMSVKCCKMHRRKKIKEIEGSDDNDLDLENMAKTVPNHKTVMDANQEADFHTKSHRNVEMANTEELKHAVYVCEPCDVTCLSVSALHDHMVGNKHRTNLGHVSPKELSQLYKLQYFLDTYLPQEPLVGLEFVEEIQMKSGYYYRCALCGFNSFCKPFLAHLTGSDHMAYFLKTHAPKLYMQPTMFMSNARYVQLLQQASAQYCKMHGRKKIMEIERSDDRDLENASRTAPDHKTMMDADPDFHTKSHPNVKMANTKELMHKVFVCKLCNVSYSSVLHMCDHVEGHKHRRKMGRVSGNLSPLLKLQYFIDTYIPQEPLVGLEYVDEMQVTKGYRYRCGVCCFYSKLMCFVAHLIGVKHITKYLNKHAPDLAVWPAIFKSDKRYFRALQQASAQYCKIYGKKKIKEADDNGKDLVLEKDAKTVSDRKTRMRADQNADFYTDQNVEFYTKSHCHVERSDDKRRGPPSEIKDNGDFLDYLEKFEIQNAEDAGVLKLILQNCTQALERFREEQAPQNQPWEELPGNSQGVADEADTFPQ